MRPEQCFVGGCGWNYVVEFVADSGGESDVGLVGWWRLTGPKMGPAVRPSEADGSTELAEVLERLREEVELWQSQLGEPYMPLILH